MYKWIDLRMYVCMYVRMYVGSLGYKIVSYPEYCTYIPDDMIEEQNEIVLNVCTSTAF